METIKLKNKKFNIKFPKDKKTLLMLLVPSIIIILFVLFKIFFQIGYAYYEVEENGERVKIGYSTKKELVEDTMYYYTKTLREDGYDIVEFNLKKYYTKKFTIFWKRKNNEQEVASKIRQGTFVSIDAKKITVNNAIIYVKYADGQKIYDKFKKFKPKMENAYIDISEIWTSGMIENYFNEINKK